MRLEHTLASLDSDDGDYLSLEECVHQLVELKQECIGGASDGSFEPTFSHQLIVIQRSLLEKISTKVNDYIERSNYFNHSEEEDYFEGCEFASYLRMYKELDLLKVIYEKIQDSFLKG